MNKCIQATQELPGCCRKDDVWNSILDFQNYHTLIPLIDTIRIHEQQPNHLRSEWFITLDGAPFSWIELDALQHELFTLQTEAISGDFDIFRGEWKIEDRKEGGIKLSYFLEFDLGIPVIEENCGDILKVKLQHYIDLLVERHGSRIKANASESRRFDRIPLDRSCSFFVDGRPVEAKLMNLSRGGMAINSAKDMLGAQPQQKVELQFGANATCGHLIFDNYCQNHRIIFQEPFAEFEFRTLFAQWTDRGFLPNETVRFYDIVTALSNGVPRQVSKLSAM